MPPQSNLWKEFRDFAFKGNLIDLAVAVVIGGAFNDVVKSLVSNVIMPILNYVTPKSMSYRAWHVGRIEIGEFLSALIHFLIIAVAMYIVIVKVLGAIKRITRLEEATTKECPFCLSSIPIKAIKCSHCTADLKPAS
jgi:large conductance mechanosensitive channel